MRISNRPLRVISIILILTGFALSSCGEKPFQSIGMLDSERQDLETETSVPICMQEDTDAVCFVAIGDVGKGNQGQYDVAGAIEDKCGREGCHFSLHLGDNFYPTGVTSVNDSQWETKFEAPYASLFFPFFVVLGNHDYGKIGNEFQQGKYQVDYSNHSDKWTMPSRYYDFKKQDVHFFGLDTAKAFWKKSSVKAQKKWVKQRVSEEKAQWRIAYGHHPYISNGPHGNAGSYEDLPAIPIVNGKYVKNLIDGAVCDDFDLFFSGHDHSLQVLKGPSNCPLTFVVSGAGASTTKLKNRNEALFAESKLGFTYVVIQGNILHLEMIDVEGEVMYEMDLVK